MDRLNPCLVFIGELRRSLDSGESLRLGIRRYAKNSDDFAELCGRWLLLLEKGGDATLVLNEVRSPYRRTALGLAERGLRGEPVAAALASLEREVLEACREETDRHLALLPLRLMIPLLLMIFPALMILLFGPLLEAFSAGLAGG